MLLIASILGVVGAALFRRTRTALRWQNLKERMFGTAPPKALIHTENRR